ncbi:MAG TPA: PASTA domain-containing protein [Solirubrobacteraceae bacterium]|nr:PASTA domain-containing protein [Solirubrobacteraceae bacterium]
MRLAIPTGAACAALLLGGCGGDDAPAAPQERVRLQVTAPADGALVRGGTVDVEGRVSPAGADVSVLGRPALVAQGRFTVVVPLEPGVNVVDVAASARSRRSAFAALRVTRDVEVTVPDLTDVVEDEIDGRLKPLGLHAAVQNGGDIFDVLRSGPRRVCEQDPAAGTKVRRGREIVVVVAKRC